jgi:hypothetical protein
MADRALQETLIAQEIASAGRNIPISCLACPIRSRDPQVFPRARKRSARPPIARRFPLAWRPPGVRRLARRRRRRHVPRSLEHRALAIPGGEAKGLIQIVARDALINGLLELGQQPLVAHNRHELGQDYTLGDFGGNVVGAAVGGAVFGVALHGAGKLGGAAIDKLMPKIFEAMPDKRATAVGRSRSSKSAQRQARTR